jgi:LAO/AO transport system kinase
VAAAAASGSGVEDLAKRLLAGDRRALARVITLIEDGTPEGREALRLLYRRTGHAHTVGVTGAPGSGKSTLVYALARELRSRGRSVGIVAVDPSSAFSSGALLGDRIRMQELASDSGVFIRSMATRGFLGGIAATTPGVVAVLDAAGKDVVIIETVGAGQDEVDIAAAAQTTVVVNTPAAGDDVQAMKAGLLEAADVLVVNKTDLPGTDALVAQLNAALTLAPSSVPPVPILKTVATAREGIVELADAVAEHRRYLEESDGLERCHLDQARSQVLALLRQRLLGDLLRSPKAADLLERLVEEVARREIDPYTAADRLVARPKRR